ncbi:hypothetical protein ABRQ22_10055 [Cellulosimicrobium sp. ES-005]|uniref:ATP-binding protein n=1 Tax=Cellulosimicrobium sp. ES-005 TaxID=3163031 RepID=A0AAU8G5M9_9MICO
MTPYSLAADPDRSVAFLRDVVGYGRLPGESSRLEGAAGLAREDRATLLAWYWPELSYDQEFDPFSQFDVVARESGERKAQRRLREVAASRLDLALVAAYGAADRTPEEIVGSVCWAATCSGARLGGVLDATQGLAFEQFLAMCRFLDLRYIDPSDEASTVSTWTSFVAERAREATDQVGRIVEGLMTEVRLALARRLDAELQAGDVPTVGPMYDQVKRLSSRTPVSLDAARAALKDRRRLGDPSQFGAVLADMLATAGTPDHDLAVEFLTELLPLAGEEHGPMTRFMSMTAETLDTVPPVFEEVARHEQGYGWLLLNTASLGARIDDALADLASVDDLRAALRKRYNPDGDRNATVYRPGDTFTAPASGSRYRGLYEALATTSEDHPTLEIDPARTRIKTNRGWFDLPPSAVRDKAWWSGTGRSSTGRPQVRAWWAAGYYLPQLAIDDDGRITGVQFHALPGRSEWLDDDADERLARSRYTVPAKPDIPYRADIAFPGISSVWRADDEQLADLRTAVFAPPAPTVTPTVGSEPGQPATARPSEAAPELSDAEQIELLTGYLRQNGEASRRAVERLLAPRNASLSDDVEFTSKRLPNLLAKARRQGRIANIGTRKQPRWVATGTPAHLVARLASILGEDEYGNQADRITAPQLAPGDSVPAELYRRVIRHVYPHVEPASATAGSAIRDAYNGEPFLTEVGMAAVLAGRHLTIAGIKALLSAVRLEREQAWEAAASRALDALPDYAPAEFDEDVFLSSDD